MNTEILAADAESIAKAAELLKKGEVVAIPTETVYGLAANAFDQSAVAKIFTAKGRPQDNPLIVHICDMQMLESIAEDIPDIAYTLAEKFWPGSLTMILKKKSVIPDRVNNGMSTVGIRMPNNAGTLALIKRCGFPLAAPSANLSGKPSPTAAKHVFDDMNGKIPLILDGGRCSFGLESTVICFSDGSARILRPGAISAEMLSEYIPVEIDETVYRKLDTDEKPISPGTKYKHYSPRAEVIIIDTEDNAAFAEYVNANGGENVCAIVTQDDHAIKVKTRCCGNNAESQANTLFSLFRELDDIGAEKIFVRCPEKTGVGLAVYNRLLRAAGFNIVTL